MASTILSANDLPDDVCELAELLLQMPRVDASVGEFSIELVAVNGKLRGLYRKEWSRIERGSLLDEKLVWPAPPAPL